MPLDPYESDSEFIKFGQLRTTRSADGTRVLRYHLDARHTRLHLHKEISATTREVLKTKLDTLLAGWAKKDAEFERISAIGMGRQAAEQMTIEATRRVESLGDILSDGLKIDSRIDWNELKDHAVFPKMPPFPEPSPSRNHPPAPTLQRAKISFWNRLLGQRRRKLQVVDEQNRLMTERWHEATRASEATYFESVEAYNRRRDVYELEYEEQRIAYEAARSEKNGKVDTVAKAALDGKSNGLIAQAKIVLSRSNYQDLFEPTFEVDFDSASSMLGIEYELPSPDSLPDTKSVRFIPGTGEIKETLISDREMRSLYDSACYQVCLRTIHELFRSDASGGVKAILFNGYSTYIDKATGLDTRPCIMSVLVQRDQFEKIDLRRVDPKACFKSLKGVSAATLSSLSAIPPVVKFNKEDKRFVDPRTVINDIDDATNLASMDWADFEHLVRELFEREFNSRGGDVHITRASSDGGVDAVAFDPDPITGGKIVIQAKRYTRTVGVSAVRDLYGTMQHEKASKGILVTTADYGPDAYQFASDKPITLMGGSQLLHLLQKHGFNAKIDIRQARTEANTGRFS